MHFRLYALFLLSAVAASCQQSDPASKPPRLRAPTGIYVGLDKLHGYPDGEPGDTMYHENIVYIRPDSLFLESNPVTISRTGDKGYSASDGGFYGYSGRIDTAGGNLTARLRLFMHDYVLEPIIIQDKDTAAASRLGLDEAIKRGLARRDSSFYKRVYSIHLTAKGFEMNGVRYVPLPHDSLPNVFPIGFPDARRFLGRER